MHQPAWLFPSLLSSAPLTPKGSTPGTSPPHLHLPNPCHTCTPPHSTNTMTLPLHNPIAHGYTFLIRRRTANGILPLSLLSSRSLLSPRCQLQTCEFPLLHLSSLSLPLISILATPMQPCSAFLPPALPPHSNSSSWSWQHRTLGGVEGEDTEQGARVGWWWW